MLTLATAPNKTAFYAAGRALAAWAVLLSVLGLSRPGFPGSSRTGRLVLVVSVVLVGGTMAAAVITS